MAAKRTRSHTAEQRKRPTDESPEEKSAAEEPVAEEVEEEIEVEEEVEVEEEGGEEEEGDEEEDGEEEEEEEGDEEEDEEEEEEEEAEEEEEEEDDEEDGEEDEEEEGPDGKRDSIRKLLEPFAKDQLIQLLKDAARADPDVLNRISESADSDTTHRKIFVFGLGWDATNETLRAAFAPFDDVLECNVVPDRATGKSKGYGFVLLRTRAGAVRALEQPQKRIGNRVATCQLASTGPIQGNFASEATGRKIFVNNVGPNVDMERLRVFFSQFGEIEDGPLGYDRVTGKLRGFAIFVFRTVEGCRRALEEPTKYFDGCQLHCQPAVEEAKLKGVGGVASGLKPGDFALAAALLGQAGGLVGQGAGLATGLSSLASQGTGLGLGAATPGLGGISPSAIRSHTTQLALQGLGAQQSIPSSASLRSLSGLGSTGVNLPPYYR